MSLTVNWKIAVGAGISALLLSALSGVLGGVGFGAILVRALLAGTIFAALGIGIEFVVRRFLPELLDADTPLDLGSHVNIVVDEEDDQPAQVQDEVQVGKTADSGDKERHERSSEQTESEDSWDDLENPEDSLVQEVQEARREDGVTATSQEKSESETESEPVKTSEESNAADTPPPAAADEVDELPDVGKFAEAFASDGTPHSTQDVGSSAAGAGEGNGQDPAMIAKALQTMLKRESE
ncbi:MAG: hypothetical protein ABR590_07200 [Spirochaetia bacterium]